MGSHMDNQSLTHSSIEIDFMNLLSPIKITVLVATKDTMLRFTM